VAIKLAIGKLMLDPPPRLVRASTLTPVVLETARLVLRPLTMADLDELVELHGAPEVQRTMGPYDRARASSRLELNEREWDEHGYGLMAIREPATDRFLGWAAAG
jgi:RimJ/RimL family protein N-acetyltransferase